MPEAERRRILPSHVEPATSGYDIVVQNQAEGADAVDPEALARARVAVLDDFRAESNTDKQEQLRAQRRQLFEIIADLYSSDAKITAQAEERMKGFVLTIKEENFHIESKLGKGSFGAAFVARLEDPKSDPSEWPQVVLKFSRAFDRRDQFLEVSDDDSDDEYSRKRKLIQGARMLVREAAVTHELTNNLDADEFQYSPMYVDAQFIPNPNNPAQRIAVLAMEYVDGVNLEKAVEALGNFIEEPKELINVSLDLAKAIAQLHKRGIIHNDVKPENAVLSNAGPVRLLDLGLASYNTSDQEVQNDRIVYKNNVEGQMRGSEYYMPNEYEELSPALDVYGLGKTIQHLLFGEDFKSYLDMTKHVNTLSRPLKDLYRLTQSMTSSEVTQRPDISEVINHLERIQAQL